MEKTGNTLQPFLQAAQAGMLDQDGLQVVRVNCMTHGDRVNRGIGCMDDNVGGPNVVGAWKKGRSS